MKHSECAQLLALMAAFDSRKGEPKEAEVESWMLLDVIQRNTLDTCRRAVTLFYDQEPDAYGRSPFLDPHQMRRFVRIAKREAEQKSSRIRAIEAAGDGPGPVALDSTCQHASVGVNEGGGYKTWSCNSCGAVVKEEALLP